MVVCAIALGILSVSVTAALKTTSASLSVKPNVKWKKFGGI